MIMLVRNTAGKPNDSVIPNDSITGVLDRPRIPKDASVVNRVIIKVCTAQGW